MSTFAHPLHRAYLIAFLVLLVLYVGCAGGTAERDPSNFRFGSQGLELRFSPGNPTVFYEGSDVSLLVEVYNRGTAPAYGEFFISGYDPSFMQMRVYPSHIISMEGKDQFDPRGDMFQMVTVAADRVRLPRNRESFPQSIQLTACYRYSTYASSEVCVDPDPYNRRLSDKVCQLSAQNPGGQGHPIIISSVEPTVSQNDIRFQIRISNSGGGQVYDLRTPFGKCGIGLDQGDINYVYVGPVTLGGQALSCEPLNPVRMLSGTGTINCVCRNCVDPGLGAYKSLLEMELDYHYRQTLTRDIQLRAVN